MVSNAIRLLRLGSPPRMALLLLAVTGIVVGLLAMHTLAAVTGGHTGQHTAVAATVPAPAGDATPGMSHRAGDGAAMPLRDHTTADLVCLLALLVLTLAVTVRVLVTRPLDARWRVAALSAALPAVLPPPSPPSLHVLSISRT